MDPFFLLAFAAVAAVFALAAVTAGVDSRDGSADSRRPDWPVGISV